MPAGGKATRVAPLPCSKELFPIGSRPVGQMGDVRPKVICHYLLENMRMANVEQVYVIIRKGKWDIPAYLADGTMLDMHLAYLMLDLPFGVPYTLDQAYPFVKNSIVVFGFPDVLFRPDDAFVHLLNRQEESGADLVLGLFPSPNPEKMDMVDLNRDGVICNIQIKPVKTQLRYTWIIAVWTPVFTDFMHGFVSGDREMREKNPTNTATEKHQELFMSHVIIEAIQRNMQIDTVLFPDGNCIDIGTPEDLLNILKVTI
jgi:glucose-1-phosphate thymidylyltransferase